MTRPFEMRQAVLHCLTPQLTSGPAGIRTPYPLAARCPTNGPKRTTVVVLEQVRTRPDYMYSVR